MKYFNWLQRKVILNNWSVPILGIFKNLIQAINSLTEILIENNSAKSEPYKPDTAWNAKQSVAMAFYMNQKSFALISFIF